MNTFYQPAIKTMTAEKAENNGRSCRHPQAQTQAALPPYLSKGRKQFKSFSAFFFSWKKIVNR
jgi:hypothetical protein